MSPLLGLHNLTPAESQDGAAHSNSRSLVYAIFAGVKTTTVTGNVASLSGSSARQPSESVIDVPLEKTNAE